ISGTPSATGNSTFTIQVRDAASTTVQQVFSLNIAPPHSGEYDSQFVSQNVPATLTPGQVFTAEVAWLNTGTQSWSRPTDGLKLVWQNPVNNSTWGGNTVPLTLFTVNPGQTLNVTFQAFAPTTSGTYNFQWQVATNIGGNFGQLSTNVAI